MPVQVTLTPAKRSIYTAGVSYGTDSGAGVRLGVERRYLNSRGHKALAQVDYAQRRKTLTLQYRIPAFAWLDGWYTASLQAADEQTDYLDTRRVEFVASRSGEINSISPRSRRCTRCASAGPIAGDIGHPAYRYATLQLSVAARRIHRRRRSPVSAQRHRRHRWNCAAASKGAGSDANFAQLHARASWFRGLGARDRLIVRGELGHTFTDALVEMPPSLRFYAGGDRSIRGYNYREVGPRIPATSGRGAFALGANNVITASTEFEHYFTPQWGWRVFVDSGSAFDGRVPDWHTGVGLGLRWRSPVGPVRVDIGARPRPSGFGIHRVPQHRRRPVRGLP